MISDINFNKTMNNISSQIINKIKDELKENIKTGFTQKLKNFINICIDLKDDLENQLNQIKTVELPEEMENLVELINNYNYLIFNQNNRFNFTFGEKPFNLLNIFIYQELEPPLLLIFEKYNSIEESLLSNIKVISENFPDCLSVVKNNVVTPLFIPIEEYIEEINFTMNGYKEELIEDIENYLNKLIHFIYIDGLETQDTPCEESDCGIPKNALRHLKSQRKINLTKYNNHNNIINITDINQDRNKDIDFNNLRKLSLPEYTPDMGALSENNVLYYLSELQNTTLKFNKTYFGKEYLNVNISTNKFLTKINYTYLEKLRFSFDIKLVKFSTILTKNSLEKLEQIILSQYIKIEEYIHESSDLLLSKINNFIREINNTSLFIFSLSGYIYNKVLGYYELFYMSIQSKYQIIKDKRIRLLDSPIGKNVFDYRNKQNTTKFDFLEIVGLFESDISFNINLTHVANIISNLFNITGENPFFKKLKELKDKFDKLKLETGFNQTIYFPFPTFPYLQLRFTLGAYVKIGLSLGLDFKKLNEIHLTFDIYGEAKVPMTVEGGFYIPSGPSSVVASFVVGLSGVIGHGRAGIKLYIPITSKAFKYDLYFIFNAFVFQFYFKIGIKINIPLFKFNYEFYIIKIEILGFHFELHTLNEEKYKAFENHKKFQFNIKEYEDYLK